MEELKNLKKIIWLTSVIILIIAGFLLVVLLYNKQLKMAVKARTNSLEKSNQEMDRFVYSISHDIRSPLSSVQGLINIMKIDPDDNEKYTLFNLTFYCISIIIIVIPAIRIKISCGGIVHRCMLVRWLGWLGGCLVIGGIIISISKSKNKRTALVLVY